MNFDLAGQVVVITGAGQGIGRSLAEAFLAEGSTVVATDVSSSALSWVDAGGSVAEGAVTSLACDVRSTESVRAAMATVVDLHGRIDVLVNNAGVLGAGLIDEYEAETWNAVFDVNVTGVFRTCQAVLPTMKRQRYGRIINAASFAAIIPSVGSAAYAASKAAVVQLTRTLAGEIGPWNITANAYAPGMVPSAMNGFAAQDPAAQEELLDTLTLRRWGQAGEVADVVRFLASDAARYVTGALIDVSGGKLATQRPQQAYAQANAKGTL
jgi:3-oxoacyl-[acyl-carrier protein] reductase